ncbi:Exportin 7, partial [Rhizopus azygosporus]
IESMTLLMQNHLSTEFTFLHNSDKHQRNRMLYYQILCKILFAEDNNEAEFYEFMKPFEDRLNELSLLSTREEFQQPQVQHAIIDLFLDLRGFIEPIQSRRSFLLFFDWFYPDYMPILLRAVEAWSPDPLTYPLLKFVGELVQNKSQRLNLDISSPNGVLLFRDASQLICSYGQQAITQHVTDDRKKYAAKYKGITICFNILARCLGGKYINFGVFWLYQDKAISDAFSMMFQMILNIPLNDMMNFPKLTRAFFLMMDEFSSEQMMIDPNLPAEAFLYILEACEIGIESSDPYIRTHACTTLNNILTFVFPQVLPRMLTSVFGMILFDDNNDQWQLSRPLYTLVLLERDFASKYTNQVIMQQLPERREYVTKLLSNLMEGSGWTLSTKDREKFSQQISNLKRELVNHQITLVPV